MRASLFACVLLMTTAVNVSEERGVYSVAARFAVPQPPPVVLSVLTDYEQIPRFMPAVKKSVVRERTSTGAVVEQEAMSRFLMFSRRVHLLLAIAEEENGTLRFRDTCGKSFVRYEGRWRISPRDQHTEISYELIVQPAFDVPEFVLTRLLRRDAAEMIERLQREIAMR